MIVGALTDRLESKQTSAEFTAESTFEGQFVLFAHLGLIYNFKESCLGK